MIYILGRQSSTNAMLGSLLSAKRGNVLTYYCVHCSRAHTIRKSYVREASSYLSALKLAKNKTLEKRDSTSNVKKEIDLQNITKIIKLSPPRSAVKRKIATRKKLSEFEGVIGALGWKNKYSLDSTKCYDPNLLTCSTEVEKFHKEFGRNGKFSSYKSYYSGVIKKLEGESNEALDNLDENFNKDNESVNKINVFKPLALKPTQRQPLETPKDVTKDRVDDFENKFNNITEVKTPDFALLQTLHSSIDICSTNGMELEAYHLFHICREKSQWKNFATTKSKYVVSVYNTLLQALSAKGYWNLIQHVIKWMESDKISLNSESYASLLCCLGKMENSENRKLVHHEIKYIVNKLLMRNIPLNDIFLRSKLTLEESELVLAVLREVVPNFEIQPVVTDLSSSCNLVKDLHLKYRNLSPALDGLKTEDLSKMVEEQMQIEKKYYVKIKAVSSGTKGNVSGAQRALLDELKDRWKVSLTNGVLSVKNVYKMKLSENPDWFNIYLYLNCIPVEKIVESLLETTLALVKNSQGFSPTCTQLCWNLGRECFQRYQLWKKEISGVSEITEKLFKNYTQWYINPQGPAMNSRQQWQLMIQDWGRPNQLEEQSVKWGDDVIQRVGKCLLDIILKSVKFTTRTKYGEKEFPVLYTVLRYRDEKFEEEIKCHPSISALLKKIGFDYMCFRADEMPMLCPPKPWKSVHHGGYLLLSAKFVRKIGGVEGKRLNLGKVPEKELFAVFDSLNSLQAVPWMINEDVLDVMLEVFKNGGSEKLSVPVYPEKARRESKNFKTKSFLEAMEERKKFWEKNRIHQNQYGLWCEALYRLSLAEHFRKRTFWMPQNCDFRGRVYPVPPLLNHLGSDLYRSLLLFAKGKPLGPKGLDWLKIHLVNLTGSHKKRPVAERLEYANEILPDILDSAERPLTGDKWWIQADDPWQTLATCMEIKKVLSAPDPESYVCRLPVHQDGSCNGLQHYAALGKDMDGAKSVNLTACEAPQDVYVAVAELIEKERIKDAELGVNIAKVLEGFVRRKVVKQTIMTTVYGVTTYGANLQIKRRLEEIPDFPQEYVSEASRYISAKTFLCLRKMFTSAKQIQEWLVNCASEVCRRGDYVQWISPLGLPVLQSYARRAKDSKSNTIVLPDRRKQKNAFPPNFIHSLDSCHMMLTSLYCEQAGLTFASVHDCFWTHPNTVDIMNKICREQFVSLHSEPILENLSEFFKNTYCTGVSEDTTNYVFGAVPEKGDFDLQDVMNSVYFFS